MKKNKSETQPNPLLSGSPITNEVTNNKGKSWLVLKGELRPNYRYIIYYCGLAFAMLLAGGWMTAWLCQAPRETTIQIIVIIAASAWFAFWLIVITSHFHEAAHFNLCSNKKWNDWLATFLLTPLTGLDIKIYRKSHWQHHKHLGTFNDTEISYHRPLTLRNVILGVSGINLVVAVLKYANVYGNDAKASSGSNAKKTPAKNSYFLAFTRALLTAILTQAAIFTALLWAGRWQVATAWGLGFFIFFPFLAMFRQILEHRSASAAVDADFSRQTHGPVNRMFGTSFFARLFGSAGFNRHLLHHWDPSVSYTNFDQFEEFLRDTELKPQLDASRSTYLKTIKELLQ